MSSDKEIAKRQTANILAGMPNTGNINPALVIVFEIQSEEAARQQRLFAAVAAATAAEEAASSGIHQASRYRSGAYVPKPNKDSSAKRAREAAASRRKHPKARLRGDWSHNDDSQAEFLWGKCNSSDNICYCCICGFPIIPDDEEVFPGKPVGTVDPKWGKGSAEHELYASKGYRYIGLYWKWSGMNQAQLNNAGLPRGYEDDNVKNFYKKEMMWSHWYCNNIKGDVPVIKWNAVKTDLLPDENNIRYIINSVWNGVPRVDATTAAFYQRYVDNEPGVKVGKYSHLIEYFLNTTGPVVRTREEGDRKVLAWKNNRLCAYITRLNDMIATLKACTAYIYKDELFHIAFRRIIDERTSNPYGMVDSSKHLTEWPPNIYITPTPAPVMANFERCDGEQRPEFWYLPDEVDSDSDYEYEYETDDSIPKLTEEEGKEVQKSLAPQMEEAAGGAGGPPRLRKTYGGARRYKQRKTLKKRRKGKRHTRRRT
jgi:hypothetical protein